MTELERFDAILNKISVRVDEIIEQIDNAKAKFTITQEQADDFCRNYCRYPIMYGWNGKDTIIEGIERHCAECPLVKGARGEHY